MKAITRLCVILIVTCSCVIFLSGCRDKRRVISFGDLEKLPTFVATVDMLHSGNTANTNVDDIYIVIGVRTQSGERLSIGNFATERESISGLARTLQQGKSYEFPQVWLEYKSRIGQGTNRPGGQAGVTH